MSIPARSFQVISRASPTRSVSATRRPTNTYIAGISGVTVSGNPVVVDASGHLGTADISTLQGPAGPQGDTGATGAAGATGPAGPAGYTLLSSTPNGKGQTTSYVVYAKN